MRGFHVQGWVGRSWLWWLVALVGVVLAGACGDSTNGGAPTDSDAVDGGSDGASGGPTETPANDAGSDSSTPSQPALKSLALAPGDATLFTGATQVYTLSGTYADGSTKPVTSSVSWTVSPATLGTITANGTLTAGQPGTGTVSASVGGLTASANVTVKDPAAVVSITVGPSPLSLATFAPQALTAQAKLADNSTADVTTQATWTSGTPAVLQVSAKGEAVGLSAGSSEVSAAIGAVSGKLTVTVTGPGLDSIAFEKAVYRVAARAGVERKFAVTATLTDNSTKDVTAACATTSSDIAIASVPAPGTAKVEGTSGSVTLTANLGGKTATATLNLSAERLFVSNTQGNAIRSYALRPAPMGDVAPLQEIVGANTQLSEPEGLFDDLENDELWVGSQSNNKVVVFAGASTVTGDAVPARAFTFASGSVRGVAYDATRDIAYVTNSDGDFSNVSVFDNARTVNGTNPTPTRKISAIGGSSSYGIALDAAHDRIYVVRSATPVAVLVIDNASTANGDLSTLTGRAITAGLVSPRGVYLDAAKDRLYVSQDDATVAVYANASSTDNPAAATAVLGGVNANIASDCDGVLVDVLTDDLYAVSGLGQNRVSAFAGASALAGAVDVAPTRVISGATTALNGPGGLAFGY